jgi:branched-chain amino acid transport system substrate-binding protein
MKSYIARFFLAIALPLVFSATSARADSILIGFSAPDTGPAAAAAMWQRWGVEIARDEINAAGGVLGKQIEIVSLDNRCNPSEAVNVANRLVEAKVTAIIGAHCSSATLATMPIIAEAKIPMVEGVATSPKITELSGVGGNDWTFRINPSDQDMMVALGKYLQQDTKIKRVAVIGEDTDFGRGGAAAFADVAKGAGIQIISTDFHPQNQPEFTSLLTRVQQSKPDAIALFQLSGDQINFLRNAMQLQVRIPYTGRFDPYGRNTPIIEAGGMEGSITAWPYSHEIDHSANKNLVAKTQERYKSIPYLQTWAGYDSLRLIAKAIGAAGSTDTTKVRDAIKHTDFVSAMGKPISFDDHDQGGKIVVIEKVDHRKVHVESLVDLGAR